MLANDMTELLNKIELMNGLTLLNKHLPPDLKKGEAWANVIKTVALPMYSRAFPHKFKMVISDETCYKKIGPVAENDNDHGINRDKTVWYYIKDEILDGVKLLGIQDIDWTDYTADNLGFSGSVSTGYYYPTGVCPVQTFESILGLQFNADMMSLYNRGIYIDFEYPVRFCLKGLANVNYDLDRFTIILLVEHKDLSTISPTKMTFMESLCSCLICAWLSRSLKYYDGLETAYLNLDLKLAELQEEAAKLPELQQIMNESAVSMSNDQCPALWAV